MSDEEKEFIESMAELNGVSLSELVRTRLLESLEDWVELVVLDKTLNAHKLKGESIFHPLS